MKRTNKKGFTIVELVIVIAVIAILAAVLIPTFVRLVRKSKINTDTQLIRNLNTALEADKVDNTHSTMSDALEAAAKYGYDVSKINASATNNEILWDSENDVFCYFNDGEIEYLPDSVDNNKKLSAESNKLWKIYNGEVPSIENQTYSIYLGSATAANSINNGKVKVGLDMGNQSVDAITYEHSGTAQTVVIRTNSYNTILTINAPNDVVEHYDKANKVDVIAVAGLSYHEHGDVLGNITLNNGRVVVENGSKANAVYIDATAEAITAGTVIVSADNSKEPEIPIILRDYVKEAADNKGGNNSIPNPATQNVIVLSDKVTVVDPVTTEETEVNAAAYETSSKKNYATVQEAIDAMASNGTIILLQDISNSSILRANKGVGNYKIDLNGHTITFTTNISKKDDDEMAFEIEGEGNYTICNGTLSCYSSEYGDVFETYCNTTLNNITINFEDQITIVGQKSNGDNKYGARWGAIYNGASEMVMNSCYINAISGPGIQNGEENAKLIINDSTIISADHSALYCGGASITEVNNSVVSGVRAIHACTSGATFIINSGTFTGTDNVIQLDNNKKAVDWQGEPNYAGGSFALVYGGTFNGNILVSNNGVAKLYVYGGDYTADVSSYRV